MPRGKSAALGNDPPACTYGEFRDATVQTYAAAQDDVPAQDGAGHDAPVQADAAAQGDVPAQAGAGHDAPVQAADAAAQGGAAKELPWQHLMK